MLEYDGNNILQARYMHGPGIDDPMLLERGSQRYYYHTDGLGSITEITDSTGTVVRSYLYDTFGNLKNQTGGLLNPYTYTGREYDSESGLMHYRARTYDPNIGRFLQEDPLGYVDGMNLFSYTKNNPVNFTDPLGLATKADCLNTLNVELALCNAYYKDPNNYQERAKCYEEAFLNYDLCEVTAADSSQLQPPNAASRTCPFSPSSILLPPINFPIGPSLVPNSSFIVPMSNITKSRRGNVN